MSDEENRVIEQLTTQLTTIQEQLSQLTNRFNSLENNLGKVSSLPAKISQLEDDLMLLGDRYRYQNLQRYLVEQNWFEADKETSTYSGSYGKRNRRINPRRHPALSL